MCKYKVDCFIGARRCCFFSPKVCTYISILYLLNVTTVKGGNISSSCIFKMPISTYFCAKFRTDEIECIHRVIDNSYIRMFMRSLSVSVLYCISSQTIISYASF